MSRLSIPVMSDEDRTMFFTQWQMRGLLVLPNICDHSRLLDYVFQEIYVT